MAADDEAGGKVMPMYFEFPESMHGTDKAHPALAEALSMLAMNAAGDSYANRTGFKGYELTEEYLEEGNMTLAIWWMLVNQDLEYAEKRNKENEEIKARGEKVTSYPMWCPSIMHFGEHMQDRVQKVMDEHNALEDENAKEASYCNFETWHDNLKEYAGFKCRPTR